MPVRKNKEDPVQQPPVLQALGILPSSGQRMLQDVLFLMRHAMSLAHHPGTSTRLLVVDSQREYHIWIHLGTLPKLLTGTAGRSGNAGRRAVRWRFGATSGMLLRVNGPR